MTGFMRNLFGPYKVFDTPDYEDLVPKLLFVEKWAVYCSGCIATYDILMGKNPPKGVLMVAKRALKFIGPVTTASATFVGALFASSHIRGKKDDEWNAFNATIVSGALYNSLHKGPWVFFNYFVFVGFLSNVYKQSELYNWTLMDEKAQMKRREIGFVTGPFLIDWTILKEYPPKWINGDEMENASGDLEHAGGEMENAGDEMENAGGEMDNAGDGMENAGGEMENAGGEIKNTNDKIESTGDTIEVVENATEEEQ